MTTVSLPPTSASVSSAVSPPTRALQRRAHELIPGGAHTYAKGDDQYPETAPPFIARGNGCHVWDLDGNEFIEYGMGLRSVALGHAFPRVIDAVRRELGNGSNFTRPSHREVEAAETFLDCVAGAEMVKFAKNGSDATTAAVKLARAVTGRDLVAICGDQPFFSTDDWFIGSTAMSAGIPKSIQDLTVKFRFNDAPSLENLFLANPDRISCVVLEAETSTAPRPGFLADVRALCDRFGALMVLDEMITGFRWHVGGAQRVHGVVPDLSTFGKAIANGFPLAALAGKREIMERGGLKHMEERVFLLSTTHGAETHSLVAGIATMRVYQEEPVIETLYRRGERLKRGADEVIRRHGVQDYVQVLGRPCNLVFATKGPDRLPSQSYRTLFMQKLIAWGVLAPSFVVSYSHTDEDIDRTIDAIDFASAIYARALDDGALRHIEGRSVKPVFRPYN
ncbi:MAG TPA: glutamate-1-semialdehyde 2,1-aminomutase [Gemmatimonadaceae bacterium]|nr:glutamate-1-semialdehyde 2,1-aminomutase [Gemmatimonadaceae bacterium]